MQNGADEKRSAKIRKAYGELSDDDKIAVKKAARTMERRIRGVGPGQALEIVWAVGRWLETHDHRH